jgi:ribosomal protein S27E
MDCPVCGATQRLKKGLEKSRSAPNDVDDTERVCSECGHKLASSTSGRDRLTKGVSKA